jgi:hypothetical protein
VSVVDSETDGGITADFSNEVAPHEEKRRGRKPGFRMPRDEYGNVIRSDGTTRSTTTRSRSASLESQLTGFVVLINTFVMAFQPRMALDLVEQTALVKALDAQCQASPKFRKYVESVVKGLGGVSLMGVVALIIARRVIRAGVLPIPENDQIKPQNIDDLLGSILFASTGKTPITSMQVPA